ncbi:unnamed protein product [Penicillium nalgiovense]|nr:unnamed protein product [Penicillium nalgiovense]
MSSNLSHLKKPSIPAFLSLPLSFPLHSSFQSSQRPISNFRSITTVLQPGNSLALQYCFSPSAIYQGDSTQFPFTTHSRFQICDQSISFSFSATIMAGSAPKTSVSKAKGKAKRPADSTPSSVKSRKYH